MRHLVKLALGVPWLMWAHLACAQIASGIVDIPTRPAVSQRVMVIAPPAPKAAVILFAGGHGGLQITSDGELAWGKGNFLVRSRQLFADQGLLTLVVDSPSDRQSLPFLTGFRQTPQHVADIAAVMAWVRERAKVPIWLVGTSRGTQSVAYIATHIATKTTPSQGPDGIVLTSTMLSDHKMLPVPALPLDKVTVPVLVVHHELDGCAHCPFSEVPAMVAQFTHAPRKALVSFKQGQSRGDPCEAAAYHGFNGVEQAVVTQIAQWITAP